GIPHGPHGGGLFMWADISRFGMDAETFCYRLLDEAGVLMFPGNAFGRRWRGWVRVSLLAPEADIREAMERIAGFTGGLVARD
ncbi:MAG: aminotransferase class I/II-fold pyridoxal phosphate-dependent enzyme, partial [Gemmatimonadetes bacterium]|nr:aminotransferase class I/II-fold pyridoxal phosphate-dependent enzyme [Gemmatimonadota bacterium]